VGHRGRREENDLSIRPRPASLKEAPDLRLQVVRQAGLVEREVASCRPYCLMRVLTNGSRERDDRNIPGGGPAPQRADDGDAVDLGKREVEDDEIEVLFLGSVERLFSSFAVTTRYPAKDSISAYISRESA